MHRFLLVVMSTLLLGASCDKKPVTPRSTDDARSRQPDPGGSNGTPAERPRMSRDIPDGGGPETLGGDAKAKYERLVDQLPSPCGKAHSLKRSAELDPDCKRTPFAQRYVAKLARLDADDEDITKLYGLRYGGQPPHEFILRDTPFEGMPNAPVVLVEFFDYGCPHCRDKAPVLEEIVSVYPSEVVVYYKQYPLTEIHKDSGGAALAAVAAMNQGKFKEMHQKLFANQGAHTRQDMTRYAKELGLDMAKFEADFMSTAVTGKVKSDQTEGEKAGVKGTPTLFVNGKLYVEPINPEDLREWILEELAVNR
jgi:predicted DsbA family dithiol-disulfide isomerase